MKLKLSNYRKEMHKYRSRRDATGVRLYDTARWNFLKLLEKEEIFWHQLAKQFWLRDGDKNTRFFHKFVSTRKENNRITRLKDDNGDWHESEEAISHVITSYYEKLFSDNALIAFEANHYIHRKTQGRTRVVGLKVDISKAYDRSEWTYIEWMLTKFGFPQMWITRIMKCIRTVSYCFVRGGKVFGDVVPQRGDRQGDPISPYIYILCARGLSGMIRQFEENGLIHGYKIARGAPRVSHLLFADDCYFFFQASQSEAEIMKLVLQSPNTRQEERNAVCEILGVDQVKKPEKYLGLPMSMGRNKTEVFGFLHNCMKQKLLTCVCDYEAKYYPRTSFLNADVGNNPSYAWRSIMAAMNVVKAGARRKIVDGLHIKVWGDPWLPSTDNGLLTTTIPEQLNDIRVNSLMIPGERCWDMEVVIDICNHQDVALIKSIPLSVMDKGDSWFWKFDESGEFTVKTCYRWLQGENDISQRGFWNKLWSLQIPSKIKNFLWRVSRWCLPTNYALAGKGIIIITRCPWCHSEEETDEHVLFSCEFAKIVWNTVGLRRFVQSVNYDPSFRVLVSAFEACTKEQCSQIALVSWSLWNRRNRWVWDKVNGLAYGVKVVVLNLFRDWKEAQQSTLSRRMQGE
ncbi:hypothetical protein AgCh_031650 [Apium graveolens]